jgi:vitamin B12 transporter
MRMNRFLLLFLLVPSFVKAQESVLDPVTVSATGAPEKVSKTGRNVIVVPGSHFAQLPVHSLDELLRYVPGIEVQSRCNMGSQSDLLIRGGTFQQVLVVLDGVRLNDPITGHFNTYIPIAPSEIERIEVLKGAGSAIFGSEAVGGVVHIISKTFSHKKPEAGKGIQGRAKMGECGLVGGDLGVHYQGSKTAINAGLLGNHANCGHHASKNAHHKFDNFTGSLSGNHSFNEHWQLGLRTAFDQRRFNAQNFYTSFVSDTAKEEVRRLYQQIQLRYINGKHQVRLSGGLMHTRDEYTYNPMAIPNKNRSILGQGLAEYQRTFSERSMLVTGAQFLQRAIRSNDRGDHERQQTSVFAVWQQGLGEYFTLSPAVRLEHVTGQGFSLVPQLQASYRKGDIQLRASAGRTTRTADFTEQYNNYQKPFVSGGSIGNPDLDVETSFSYEAGVDYFVCSSLKASFSVFRREQKGVIDWTPTPYSDMPRKDNLSPTGSYALARNIAEIQTTGAELDLQFSYQFSADQSLWANVGLLVLDSETSEVVPSFYTSAHAKGLVNFSGNYQMKKFSFGVNGLYKERKAMQAASPAIAKVSPNYFQLNVRAGYGVIGRLGVFVEVDNVTDTEFTDLLGARMPGRWVMAGIMWK